MNAFIARQPIFDVNLNVVAYELLFRDGFDNAFDWADDTEATSHVIVNSFLNFEIEKLTSGKRAFINVNREVLIRNYIHLLPANKVVPEILETVLVDREVIEACQQLKKAGFDIALDDLTELKGWSQLKDFLDVVKVDFSQTSVEQQSFFADHFLPRKVNILAEKVETREEFSRAQQLGYQYFQGFFFAQPEMLFRKEIPGTKLHYLGLLQEINHHELDLIDLAAIVERDVSLSYKLLRYINATYFTQQREIRSLHQALVTLGERQIRQWASLVAVSMIADEKPDELLRMSIARAKFCELLATKAIQQGRVTDAFLVGMFSLLDVVLDTPMSEIMESVPLSQNIKDGLLGEGGFERQLLDLAISYERADWPNTISLAQPLGLDSEFLPIAYLEALEWASQSIDLMG